MSIVVGNGFQIRLTSLREKQERQALLARIALATRRPDSAGLVGAEAVRPAAGIFWPLIDPKAIEMLRPKTDPTLTTVTMPKRALWG